MMMSGKEDEEEVGAVAHDAQQVDPGDLERRHQASTRRRTRSRPRPPATRPMASSTTGPSGHGDEAAAAGDVADAPQEPGVRRQEAQLGEELRSLAGGEEGAAEDGQHHGHHGDGRGGLVLGPREGHRQEGDAGGGHGGASTRRRPRAGSPQRAPRRSDVPTTMTPIETTAMTIETMTLPTTMDHQCSGLASIRASVPARRSVEAHEPELGREEDEEDGHRRRVVGGDGGLAIVRRRGPAMAIGPASPGQPP